jgi:hypothetical protein
LLDLFGSLEGTPGLQTQRNSGRSRRFMKAHLH